MTAAENRRRIALDVAAGVGKVSAPGPVPGRRRAKVPPSGRRAVLRSGSTMGPVER